MAPKSAIPWDFDFQKLENHLSKDFGLFLHRCFNAYDLECQGAGGRGVAFQSGVARQVLLRRVR